MIRNQNEGMGMKKLIAMGLMCLAPFIVAVDLKPDLQQGKAKVEAVCITCHTIDGNSVAPIYPIIAGQHKAYLQKQLTDFKTGKRLDNVMRPWALTLTEQDIVNVSAYYAAQKLKLRAANNKELAQKGETIYRGGIFTKKVPACLSCHGPNGAGIPTQYPQLTSQHNTYIEAQLQSFKKDTRQNDAANVMRDIAAKLSDEEIKAVAEYIAGLR
jgi:cytochrome c553